jgi:Arc/MetJ-type ribon-helix-helix transcriptional regulator
MPSSTRLDKETEALLKKAAEYAGVNKSELVRESIRDYCTRIVEKKKRTPWEIYQSLQPIEGSGHGKRAAKSKEILKKKFEGMRKKWSS